MIFKGEQKKIDHITERLFPKAISRDQKPPTSAISRDEKLLFQISHGIILVSISNHGFPLDPCFCAWYNKKNFSLFPMFYTDRIAKASIMV